MSLRVLLLPVLAVLTAVASLFFPRDGVATLGIANYDPGRIVSQRLWQENPIQLINTFFLDDTVFWGLGSEDRVSQEFARRLELKFGKDQVDRSNSFFSYYRVDQDDTEDNLRLFGDWLARYGYYTKDRCPHDGSTMCEIGLAWNREITRTKGVELIFLRTGENQYTFVDSTIVGSPGA